MANTPWQNVELEVRTHAEVWRSLCGEMAAKFADINKIAQKHTNAILCWAIVEELRTDEGHDITIVCDNPDFNGQPNSKVTVRGDWTGWDTLDFTGDTVLEALQAAKAAKDRFTKETDDDERRAKHEMQPGGLLADVPEEDGNGDQDQS